MDRIFVNSWRLAVISLILNLVACQQNRSDNRSKTSANAGPTAAASKQIQSTDPPAANTITSQGPIIELAPPTASNTQQVIPGGIPTQPTPLTASPVDSPAPSAVAPDDSSNTSLPSPTLDQPATVDGPSASSPSVASPPDARTDSADQSKPSLGNVATDAERNQKIAEDWPKPQVVLYVSGQQQGYIEPCGCTGLDSQKGGLIRRDTVLSELRSRGWDIYPIDVGNQNRQKRASGPQPQIKFETTAKAMQLMGYRAAALGVYDLELRREELINIGASDPDSNPSDSASSGQRPFISGNVVVYGEAKFFPAYRIIEAGGRKIGITSVIGKEFEKDVVKPGDDEIEFLDPVESLKKIVPELKAQNCDFVVLLAHTTLDESASLGKSVAGIDLVVTAGGYGEPTLLPEPIADSQAVMVQVGTKGMYGGIVGLFNDPTTPIRYQKIAISSQFKDSDRMLKLFADYQDRLKEVGFSGLGLTPALHPTGRKFVGSETCGECHTQAYEIWKNSPHIHATDSIVAANNDRGGIERHYDPECVSCHVTGWNPQQFSPFETGYANLDESKLLLGSGCENCHGPGSMHVDIENGVITASAEEQQEHRQEMILPLAKAEEKCMECHDFDNSPDFHAPGAFEEYWEQVKHYGKD